MGWNSLNVVSDYTISRFCVRSRYQIWGNSTVKWDSKTSLAQVHCSWTVGNFCYHIISVNVTLFELLKGHTFWILYLLRYCIRSMIIQGSERPKYTSSCITNDMTPVARTSFCIKAYQAAHKRSRTLKWTLYLEISSNWPQYVSGGDENSDVVEFL